MTSRTLVLFVAFSSATAIAQTPRPAGTARHVAVEASTNTILLSKATDMTAVIRAGAGALEKIAVGDFVGKTRALVKEISPGRLVLEENFTETDGKPNRALIVIKEGERGGTRFLQRPPPDL
jgi:hypothetical protein